MTAEAQAVNNWANDLPFARVEVSKHSTTYIGESGVQAKEYMMPNRYMNAMLAFAVLELSGSALACFETGVRIAKHPIQAISEYISSGLLPTLSSNIAPVREAMKQRGALIPLSKSFFCWDVIPAFSSITGR